MEAETCKLLGTLAGGEVDWHPADVSASCNRIPTLDGHLENVWVDLAAPATEDEAASAMEEYPGIDLRSAPDRPIHVFDDPDRPQPRLDRMREGGMQVSVGGIQRTTAGVQFNCLAHNTMRGAAGASVLNGELLLAEGWL